MSSASVEPLEIIDSCFSNHGFNAAIEGRKCSLRAGSRMSGDEPRTMASMAESCAMCRTAASAIRDLLLRTKLTKRRRNGSNNARASKALVVERDFVQPVIAVIGVALQIASAKAVQELLREGAAATGGCVRA